MICPSRRAVLGVAALLRILAVGLGIAAITLLVVTVVETVVRAVSYSDASLIAPILRFEHIVRHVLVPAALSSAAGTALLLLVDIEYGLCRLADRVSGERTRPTPRHDDVLPPTVANDHDTNRPFA